MFYYVFIWNLKKKLLHQKQLFNGKVFFNNIIVNNYYFINCS
ncbi:MAG: hypothetical protein RL757_2591 [Bacteroidota bacterium]|jgi:hypothetical protein